MNKFDQEIKDKLNLPQTPPLDAWEMIEKRLDIPKKRKKRTLIFWVSTTAASAILIGGIAFLYHQPVKEVDSLVKQKTKSINKSNKIQELILNTTDLQNRNGNTQDNLFVTKIQNDTIYYSKSKSKKAIKGIHFSAYSEEVDNNFINQIDFNSEKHSPQFVENQEIFKDLDSRTDLQDMNFEQEKIEDHIAKTDDDNFKFLTNEIDENVKQELKSEDITKHSKLLLSTFASPIKMVDAQSILSNNFNSHPIQNNVTLAYGAKVSYRINEKLSVRTGLSKISLDQMTDQITTSSVSKAATASNTFQPIVPISNSVDNIRYYSEKTILPNAQNYPSVFYIESNNQMNHQLQFLEIPVEVEYQIFTKNKLNVAAIAGGSYFLLEKNELFLTNKNTQQKEKIGTATNVNKASISTNAAIKFEYKLTDKFKIQLEPNYRLLLNQTNDVNQNSTSILGVNFGLGIDLQ